MLLLLVRVFYYWQMCSRIPHNILQMHIAACYLSISMYISNHKDRHNSVHKCCTSIETMLECSHSHCTMDKKQMFHQNPLVNNGLESIWINRI